MFVSDRDKPGNWDIYALELSTGAINRLTFDPAIDNHPDLSPDGSRIVFSSTRGAGVDFDIYIADVSNIDGTAIRLTDDSYPNGSQAHYPDRHPHFSPDGTLIIFDSKNRPLEFPIEVASECSVPIIITPPRFYENLNVIRIDAAGNMVTYVDLDIRDAWDNVTYPDIWRDDNATYVGHPSFSPDGSQIIFTAAIDGDGTVWEAYTVDIEIVSLSLVSDSLIRITNGSDYPPNPNPIQMSGGAHFTADGNKVIFSSTRTPQGNSQLFWAYADEMLLIGDEVSWFCGLKPNLSSCTYQPRIFDMEALWLMRYADTMIPLDLLQRFNISDAPPLYNIYWNNLEEYVLTQPHLQNDWVNILEGTEFLMATFPGFGDEPAFQGWMMETAGTRDQLFVLPSIMHEYGIGNPPPPEFSPGGTGTASVEVDLNPGGHPSYIPSTLELTWNIDGSTITITGIPGVGELTGTLEDTSFFSATGNGTYATYSTSFRIDGLITPDGISGLLNIGSDGGLPGGDAIVYEFELIFP